MHRRVLLCILALLAVMSCARPGAYEEFIRVSDAVSGRFCFDIDMSDSLDIYDVWLYSRIDRQRPVTLQGYDPIKLRIWWVSPSQKVYDEEVYMESGDYRGVRQLYRSGIEPSERGVWKLWVEPVNPPGGFRGLGVIFERYGAR